MTTFTAYTQEYKGIQLHFATTESLPWKALNPIKIIASCEYEAVQKYRTLKNVN